MATEIIGEPSGGGYDSDDWREFVHGVMLKYLEYVSHPLPTGCGVEIALQDHELGTYPMVVLNYPDGCILPIELLERCQIALDRLSEHVGWDELDPLSYQEELDECGPRFADSTECFMARCFAMKLIEQLLRQSELSSKLQAALGGLYDGLERLPRRTREIDVYVRLHQKYETNLLVWMISLSETEFSAALYRETGLSEREEELLCGYFATLDNEDCDESTEERLQDNEDIWDRMSDHPSNIQSIVMTIDRIYFKDIITQVDLDEQPTGYAYCLKPGGQTALSI